MCRQQLLRHNFSKHITIVYLKKLDLQQLFDLKTRRQHCEIGSLSGDISSELIFTENG